ncbi:aldo/keto reductase [Rhodocytophaga rosea]|uniref:Aldo/keto reductase n=1 Tax=Rhodocytophaga rosea TaxID=2704465 RepID=A0A6C0GBV7_9BACT|nr:aldo/keto reductase [Rhodocytophaga rosea]QHT65421.1 aldo/keto reductase [Rhodocytophaga rosea]
MIFQSIQGTKVPALGFGTWKLNGLPCEEAVQEAIDIGYRHIDTAAMYGNEEYVGNGIQLSGIARNELFVTSKVWHTHLSKEKLRSSAEDSLRKLNIGYLDLLLIHWPNPDVPLEESIGAMLELQQEGKIRHIGVSNFSTTLLQKALQFTAIFCNQVEYHPYLSQKPLLDLCQQQGILLTAYAPVAHGEVMHDPVLQEIGKKYGKSPIQVTLRWLLHQPFVAAIPKAGSNTHRKNNFDIFDFTLKEEEMQAIFKLNRNSRMVNPSWAHEW